MLDLPAFCPHTLPCQYTLVSVCRLRAAAPEAISHQHALTVSLDAPRCLGNITVGLVVRIIAAFSSCIGDTGHCKRHYLHGVATCCCRLYLLA